ncbi:glycosyl transferase group 1 [Pseudodesulfovibrio mercurii]|uniref:Glycosyl transferase group 1 n=1 Tax=Pseudodesulfovibrio mercurii TaxID=641491 RepID=F0JCA4_9BACT|nr:glycosyltransferase family 4 protein [Pseudodesulfovibrio mercurii]EGB14402.1 glycosyl transferase group 1 [Pseudodesulfovibrio mercurii]
MLKILDILPPKGSLDAPLFRSRYEDMPEDYAFHVLVTGDTAHDGAEFGRARLHVQPPAQPWTRWRMIRRAVALAVRAVRLARREKVDVIVCYDPLTLGLIGVLAKLFSGARLVVEVNGHLRDAKDAQLAGRKVGWLKRKTYTLLGTVSLLAADCVKILNRDQFEEWRFLLERKPVFMFHNYMPIRHFVPSEDEEPFICCLGFPFYRKGVDVLLEAFRLIRPEFPEYRLIVRGHCHEPEFSRWKALAAGIDNVEFLKPIDYDRVGDFLGRCAVLVNPARSEGMGRVFIDAMACGKPCIGTRVGGIPNVVVDGETGFLVAPEDPQDLAARIRVLLADAGLRRRMGGAGRRRAETVLSEERYVRCFQAMMERVTQDGKGRVGLIFNGFEEQIREPEAK